jgi:hypothetical protein
LLYRKITKKWNPEEYQLYDDGNPHQCAESKTISIWLTSFGPCVKWLMPLLMCKIFGRKEKDWKCPAQVYKWYTCYRCILCSLNNVILGYSILDCWYEMSYKATQCKNYNDLNNLQKNVVTMRIKKQIKVLLCFRRHHT